MRERLVAVAHGSRSSAGTRTVTSLVRRVARRLPDVEVVGSFVELAEPALSSVMSQGRGPSVVVPLLLSTGYHVNHDLPRAAALSDFPVVVAPTLGPHPLLAVAGAMQLRSAGASPRDAVVLVAAGSTDPDATAQGVVAGGLLQRHWRAPVRVGFLSGPGPTVPQVFAQLHAEGHRRVATSLYLLAPGHFASKATSLAEACGTTAVSTVLGRHALLPELVIRRYVAARRRAGRLAA